MIHLLPQIEKISLLVFLISGMLAMGMALTPEAMIAPLRNVRLVTLALGLNFVFAPAFAWLIAAVIPLDRGYAAGLLLLGGAAGAPFLPQMTEIARGDMPLAAALVGLLTLGTILFLPFALPWVIPGAHPDPWTIAAPLLLLIVMPLCAGMFVKHFAASLATRAAPVFSKIANIGLLAFFVLLISLNVRLLLGALVSGAVVVGALYFLGLFTAGWLAGGSKPPGRAVMGLATAGRNFGAALVPATSCFNDPKVTVMITVGAIVCLIVLILAAGWVRQRTETALF